MIPWSPSGIQLACSARIVVTSRGSPAAIPTTGTSQCRSSQLDSAILAEARPPAGGLTTACDISRGGCTEPPGDGCYAEPAGEEPIQAAPSAGWKLQS